ncbi:MAG: NAD-dependent epimerase/dehydratase family protein [Pseudomonadota bacterium]|nr:NAD-dependent epimerase/dehydratase family protein [Pseudomonadota bacterium]
MTRRRILLTGATGGLGLGITRELIRRGHEVIAVGRSKQAGDRLALMGARVVLTDLEAPSTRLDPLLAGVESVIHAAALSASWGPARSFQSANVEVTRNLLEAATKAAVSRFVFVSSPSIFASYEDRLGMGEADNPAAPPLNHYARTKLAAERLVMDAATPGMACCAIRPRALVGEGDAVILPKLAEMAQRPRIPLPRGGQALIELTDLRDAAWAICEAEERAASITRKAINISGNKPVPVREVAAKLSEKLGCTPRFTNPPMIMLKALAAALETLGEWRNSATEPLLTRYTLTTLAYSQSFDPEPAKRLLGYAPRHDALSTLLEQAAQMAAKEQGA